LQSKFLRIRQYYKEGNVARPKIQELDVRLPDNVVATLDGAATGRASVEPSGKLPRQYDSGYADQSLHKSSGSAADQ